MTIRDALDHLRAHSQDAQAARLESQWLLMRVLNASASYLYGYPEHVLTEDEGEQVRAYAARLAAGEPLAYILGTAGFYGSEFVVSPAVLIPRPETEHLIEAVRRYAKDRPPLTIADIGTGSGIIPITLALHLPQAVIHAVDVSADALSIARQNAAQHGTPITFYQGDLAAPLIAAGVRVDVLCANLPYIPSEDVPLLAVSRYEPTLALDGGTDGLRLIERLLTQVKKVCTREAALFLEIGSGQGAAVRELAESLVKPSAVEVIADYAGHERVVVIRR